MGRSSWKRPRVAATAAAVGGEAAPEAGWRSEHDLLGDRNVPAEAYYGIQTLRAQENYQITDIPISHFPNFPRALGKAAHAPPPPPAP
jgi:hypothetical protein